MAELSFYTNPMSRGQIARWMLEEVGQPYDQHIIGYDVMHDAEYRAVNPMMKVPAIIHRGRTVTECAGIIAYLADVFPEAGLTPRDHEKADYYRWLFFAAGPLEQAVTNKAGGFEPSAEKGRMFGYGSFDLAVNTLADHLSGRTYVCGDRFTAADVYVGSQVLWGTQFGTLPSLQPFLDYGIRLSGREAYQRAKAIDGKLIADMQAATTS
jgi:glutathione S-transferase